VLFSVGAGVSVGISFGVECCSTAARMRDGASAGSLDAPSTPS